uniref:F-box/LRR-repeat protein At3g03360-like n=1 Tax=Nicotiana sylvestris TaxID=4096 RepID=A0A1U7VL30_NICSY|nr:PREDICTED: F-box/LRR-repeat protein At3g03360-like [Nicotiana sylvestris]
MSQWLSFAVERKVEDFVYWSNSNKSGCTLPVSFYTCSSLVTLHLTFYCFDSGAVIKWNSLKSIKLEHLVLSDKDIANLVSGCPALETMEFDSVGGFLRPVSSAFGDFKISGVHLKCRLVDVSSLVTAILTFHTHCIKDGQALLEEDADDEEDNCRDSHQFFGILVRDYLQKLRCASELTIGNWFIEVRLWFKGVHTPDLKCKYLTLEELHLEKFNLFGVAGLLRAFRHVETLNIDFATCKVTSSLYYMGFANLLHESGRLAPSPFLFFLNAVPISSSNGGRGPVVNHSKLTGLSSNLAGGVSPFLSIQLEKVFFIKKMRGSVHWQRK